MFVFLLKLKDYKYLANTAILERRGETSAGGAAQGRGGAAEAGEREER